MYWFARISSSARCDLSISPLSGALFLMIQRPGPKRAPTNCRTFIHSTQRVIRFSSFFFGTRKSITDRCLWHMPDTHDIFTYYVLHQRPLCDDREIVHMYAGNVSVATCNTVRQGWTGCAICVKLRHKRKSCDILRQSSILWPRIAPHLRSDGLKKSKKVKIFYFWPILILEVEGMENGTNMYFTAPLLTVSFFFLS